MMSRKEWKRFIRELPQMFFDARKHRPNLPGGFGLADMRKSERSLSASDRGPRVGRHKEFLNAARSVMLHRIRGNHVSVEHTLGSPSHYVVRNPEGREIAGGGPIISRPRRRKWES